MQFDRIYSPKREAEQVVELLKRHMPVHQISLSDLSDSVVQHLKFNAFHAITNQSSQFGEDEFSFLCFKVGNIQDYKEYGYELVDSHEEFIYGAIERKTGFILSNSSRLQLELVLIQGVSEEDIRQNSMYLKYYLDCFQVYQEQFLCN